MYGYEIGGGGSCPGDADYKQNVIHISKTVTYNEDGTAGTGSPKSESGKRDIRPRALRDTFAARFIEQTLKVILGHSSPAMTMDLYSHVLPNTKQQEMDNLRII